MQDSGQRVGWASLQVEDDDPFDLQALLLGAVHDALPRGCAAPAGRARPAGDGDPTPDGELELVLRLAETVRRADVPVWVMLDDVHVVQSAGAVRALDLLLQWALANLHVVLAARSDPRVSSGACACRSASSRSATPSCASRGRDFAAARGRRTAASR